MLHVGNEVSDVNNRIIQSTTKVYSGIEHMEKEFRKYVMPENYFPLKNQ
jgi:hypothetical protein